MKTCRDCGVEKDLEEFYLNPRSTGVRGGDGRRSRCIDCYREFIKAGKDHDRQRRQQREKRRAERVADPEHSWRSNLRKYRMTPDSYREMLESQGGVCAICKEPPAGKRLSVDHDHSCCSHSQYKKYLCGNCNRGLLCQSCNTAIGLVKEDISIMKSAIEYLERTKS